MIVVDASVLVTMLVDDTEKGRTARSVTSRLGQWVAPDIVDVETMSALRRLWLSGHLGDARFVEALADLDALEIDRYPSSMLMDRAFRLRANVTPYDACYIALAEALDCHLVTFDGRLAAAPGVHCRITVVGSHHV